MLDMIMGLAEPYTDEWMATKADCAGYNGHVLLGPDWWSNNAIILYEDRPGDLVGKPAPAHALDKVDRRLEMPGHEHDVEPVLIRDDKGRIIVLFSGWITDVWVDARHLSAMLKRCSGQVKFKYILDMLRVIDDGKRTVGLLYRIRNPMTDDPEWEIKYNAEGSE